MIDGIGMTEKLTPKRRLFLERFFACSMNATEAARQAGYKHPNVMGPRLVKVGIIQQAIKERLAVKAMDADEVIAHFADIARFDTGLLLGKAGIIDWDTAKERGYTRFVKKIERTTTGTKIETYSRSDALEKLGKHLGLWKDDDESKFDVTFHVVYDDD